MIESGSNQFKFETIWRIANGFDIPPHILIKYIEEESNPIKSGE
jgi:transcriptional regulator with XRE-family HTH domain